MPYKHGEIHWTELATRDVDAACAYYAEICGWQFQSMPMPDGTTYHVAMMGEEMVCGIYDMSTMPGMEGLPAHWLTYLAVDNVDTAAEATAKAGGQVIRAPWDVDGVGRIAIVSDPAGAAVGLMTPSE